MTYTYTSINKNNFIYQPQFSRSRQIYRGPMSSLKFNQEAAMIRFDIFNINKKLGLVENTVKVRAMDLVNGTYLPGVTYNGSAASFSGMDALAYRLESLIQRVNILERGLL
jgi:hypothetical protein